MARLLASAAPQLPLQWAQGAAKETTGALHISLGPPFAALYQEEELTHPVSFHPPLYASSPPPSSPTPLQPPLSVSVSLYISCHSSVGRGTAHPAGFLEGGPGAKAGEGEGRGAAQGWHGDPRPHPQLCGKVRWWWWWSVEEGRRDEWQRQLSVFVL